MCKIINGVIHMKYDDHEAHSNDWSCKMITTPLFALTKDVNHKEKPHERNSP
jgi:hypothetical protein